MNGWNISWIDRYKNGLEEEQINDWMNEWLKGRGDGWLGDGMNSVHMYV